jgi:hypothetical protein
MFLIVIGTLVWVPLGAILMVVPLLTEIVALPVPSACGWADAARVVKAASAPVAIPAVPPLALARKW